MTERFVYRSKSEVDNNMVDIMYLEDLEPTREEWISFRMIWDKEFSKIKYPCHLKNILAQIKISWDNYQEYNWKKTQEIVS